MGSSSKCRGLLTAAAARADHHENEIKTTNPCCSRKLKNIMTISQFDLMARISRSDRTSAAVAAVTGPAPDPPGASSRLLTIGEVAQELAVSVDQVAQFRDTGDLAFVNIASPRARRPTWRITRESFKALLQRRQPGGQNSVESL
jgi:hypothetical protein